LGPVNSITRPTLFQDGRDHLRDIPRVDRGRPRLPERQADRAVLRDRFGGPLREEEVLEEYRRADVDHGQPGPVQGLLAQPVHPLLERVGHRQEAHLRDGQLRDVDEDLQTPQLTGDRGGCDGRFQVRRGHAHTEIQTAAAVQGPRDVLGPGEIAHDDLGPRRPERLGPIIIRPHQGPDRQALAAQDVDHLSTHPSDTACGAGDENR
jgi:hypothetical protein